MSNNLNISQVAAGQQQKEVTINDASGQLDAAITELETIDLDASDVTVTAADYRRHLAFEVSTTTSGRTLTLQAVKKLSVIRAPSSNTEDFDLALGSTTVTVNPGSGIVIYTDGTADGLYSVGGGGGGGGGGTVDVGGFTGGAVPTNTILLRFLANRAFTLPSGLPDASGHAGTAPSADTDFDIQLNGTSVGTMTFLSGSSAASFTLSSQQAVSAGDRLDVVSPGTVNGIADVSYTIGGAI